MEEWTETAKEDEVEPGKVYRFDVEGEKVLVTRLGGKVRAYGHECPHYHAPLSEGILHDGEITCPWHNAKFDLQSGELVSPPALDDLPVYDVKTEGGQIFVRGGGKRRIEMPGGSDSRRFLIVGGGAAGAAAAENLRREGFAGEVLMLIADSDAPYDRTMLSKGLLSGADPAKYLPLRGAKFYERLQIQIQTNTRVVKLDPGKLAATLADGSELEADEILLATGGVARKLPIEGIDLEHCYSLRSAADARAVIARMESLKDSEKKAVILGAGFIGLEAAASLIQRGFEVHVVAPEAEPMSLQFGSRIGKRIRGLHEGKGVHFHMGQRAQRIMGDEQVRSVRLEDGAELEALLVLYAFGVEPATRFLKDTGLLEDGAVAVDETLRTGAAHIYAAGDIALVPYAGGHSERVEHWVEAQRQGRHAALSMLGGRNPYRSVPFFWTNQYDGKIKYVGFPSAAELIAYRGDVDSGSFVAGLYAIDGRLVGVAGMAADAELLAAERVLRRGEDISCEDFPASPVWEER